VSLSALICPSWICRRSYVYRAFVGELLFSQTGLTSVPCQHRECVWKILKKIGCPPKFINIIRSFYYGMLECVLDNGELSASFNVTHGTKQGCVFAPLFLSIYSMMLLVAYKDCDIGIPIQFCTDENICNLQHLLFADDCALVAHSQDAEQELFDRFAKSSNRFGLTFSLKKTEVSLQPSDLQNHSTPVIQAGCTALKSFSLSKAVNSQ